MKQAIAQDNGCGCGYIFATARRVISTQRSLIKTPCEASLPWLEGSKTGGEILRSAQNDIS